jgi:RNA polymerase sigma-70 factor (ECF subfamily)
VSVDRTRNSHLPVASEMGALEADADVLRRLAAGDREAVGELYDRHAARVLGLAYRIVRNTSDAEDVVQDVFAQAWRTAPNYQASRGTVAGWLLMMARTRAIDRLRARQTRRDAGAEPDPERVPSNAVPVPDQIIANQQAARVRGAMVALPSEQKTALELAYFEGLSQSEIAERLQIPLGTVKTRIRSALALLRRSVRS